MDDERSGQERRWDTGELDCAETATDLLDRSKLVEHLAQGLLRFRTDESLVTAIYGPWGSGKSWIKYQLLKELRAISPDLIIVEFAPWQIRGVDELTLQFFSQVYDQIDPPSSRSDTSLPSVRARLWAKLARLSGVVPAAVRITGGAIASVAGDPNIAVYALAAAGAGEEFSKLVGARAEEAKEQATESEEKPPRTVQETRQRLAAFFNPDTVSRLLVILDDFDRLTAEEIQAMVRLIKANANFAGLNYLLLCDPEQLALALDDVASGKGREFLEKIVQNPIRLPYPGAEIIFTQLFNGLEAIAQRLGVPFDSSGTRLRYYFDGFLHYRLRTLRSVYRLIQALDFSTASLTRDGQLEVDIVDLCAVDYLRLNLPGVADWIHEEGAKFFSPGGMFGQWHSNEEKPKFSAVLPEHLILNPGVAECYAVLRQLFPSIQSSVELDRAFASALTHFVCKEEYPLALRSEEHFDAYFVLQPSTTKIPEGVLRETLNALKAGGWEGADLSQWSRNCWLVSAIRRFNMELPSLTDRQKQDLFLLLSKSGDTYGCHDSLENFYNELRWVSDFLESLLQAQPEFDRQPLLERLFSAEYSLYFRSQFLENLWIRCVPADWPDTRARDGTPLVSRLRLSELQASLAPDAENAILRDKYFENSLLETRIYRWVNSLGIAYTEPTMKKMVSEGRHDLVWQIMRGVARSIAPQYRLSFEVGLSYSDSTWEAASGGYFAKLLKFAGRDFWEEFDRAQRSRFPTVEVPKNGDACLIHHVRRALEKHGSEDEATQ